MKAFLHSVNYWKLAWFLCFVMAVGSMINTFLAMTETWSDKTWDEMGVFTRFRLAMQCSAAGLFVVIAFLNKTVARLEEGKEGDTQRWKKEQLEAKQ